MKILKTCAEIRTLGSKESNDYLILEESEILILIPSSAGCMQDADTIGFLIVLYVRRHLI